MDRLLFVYGTLRCGCESPMRHMLSLHAELIATATFQGRLFSVDGYPGAVPSDNPEERVRGELYRLIDEDYLLKLLDDYEECGPGFPDPHEYVREIREVRMEGGETVHAWIYLYNRPTCDLGLIRSGDFLYSSE